MGHSTAQVPATTGAVGIYIHSHQQQRRDSLIVGSARSYCHHKLAGGEDNTESVCLILSLLLVVNHHCCPSPALLFMLMRKHINGHTNSPKTFWNCPWGVTACNFRGYRCLLQESAWPQPWLVSLVFQFSSLKQDLTTVFLYFNEGFWYTNTAGCSYLIWKEKRKKKK